MDQPIVADLQAMAQVADQGIVSKSIVENEHHKIIHFTFAPGQELSEHTASVPAAIQILGGAGDGRPRRHRVRGGPGQALLHAGRDEARGAGLRGPGDAPHDVQDLRREFSARTGA